MEDLTKQDVIDQFANYVVSKKEYPDLANMIKEMKVKKKEFTELFNSIESIKDSFWLNVFEETMKTLLESPEYYEYTVRDKMLSFYFTLIQFLTDYRDYIIFEFENSPLFKVTPSEFSKLKKVFNNYSDSLLEEGKNTGEIASRPLIESKLTKILWAKLVFIIKFWIKDKSEDYIKTDAAIEKSVHLAFDILGRNIADSLFDFGKFLIQSKKKK